MQLLISMEEILLYTERLIYWRKKFLYTEYKWNFTHGYKFLKKVFLMCLSSAYIFSQLSSYVCGLLIKIHK